MTSKGRLKRPMRIRNRVLDWCGAAILGLSTLSSMAVACPFYDDMDLAVVRQLRANSGAQVVTMDGLTGRGPAEITLRFGGGVGAPRVSGTSAKANVVIPRTYLLDVFAWEQHLLLCEFLPQSCGLNQAILDDYRARITVDEIPFMTDPASEDPECTFRQKPGFLERAGNLYLSSSTFIQLHEIAHVVLGHLEARHKIGPREEAHADGFAWELLKLAKDVLPNGRRDAAGALLPLQRAIFASDAHPDPRCRALAFGAPAQIWPDAGPDCTVYHKGFAEGIGYARRLVTSKTTLQVYP